MLGQAAFGIAKGCGLAGIGSLRAQEHLVPCAEARLWPIDDQLKIEVRNASTPKRSPTRSAASTRSRLLDDFQRALANPLCDARNCSRLRPRNSRSSAVARAHHFLDQRDAFQQIGTQRRARDDLLAEVGEPRREQIGPRLDGKDVARVFGGNEFAAPSIVVEQRHRRLVESSRPSCAAI